MDAGRQRSGVRTRTDSNPALEPRGPEQALWMVRLDGAAPRRIGEGDQPAGLAEGDRIAYVRRGQMWLAGLDGSAPAQAFQARGTSSRPVWSPDGTRIAFTNSRGDHSFVGVFDTAATKLRFLDPSTSYDSNPEWSADGRNIAFTRLPSSGLRQVREARRAGEPWSIRVAAVETGVGREVWRPPKDRARSSVHRQASASCFG